MRMLRWMLVGCLALAAPAWAEPNYGCPDSLSVTLTGTAPADLKGATAETQKETLKLAKVTSDNDKMYCHYNQTGAASSPAWKLLTLDRPIVGKCPAPGTLMPTAEGNRQCYLKPMCPQGDLVSLDKVNPAVCSTTQPPGVTDAKCNVCCVAGGKAEGDAVACTGPRGPGVAKAFMCAPGFQGNALHCVPK